MGVAYPKVRGRSSEIRGRNDEVGRTSYDVRIRVHMGGTRDGRWWQGRDSNPRHKAYEASALPLSYPAAISILRLMTPLPPSGAYPASDFTAREEMASSV